MDVFLEAFRILIFYRRLHHIISLCWLVGKLIGCDLYWWVCVCMCVFTNHQSHYM